MTAMSTGENKSSISSRSESMTRTTAACVYTNSIDAIAVVFSGLCSAGTQSVSIQNHAFHAVLLDVDSCTRREMFDTLSCISLS